MNVYNVCYHFYIYRAGALPLYSQTEMYHPARQSSVWSLHFDKVGGPDLNILESSVLDISHQR